MIFTRPLLVVQILYLKRRSSDSRDKEKSRDRKEREPHSSSKGRSAAADDPADD